MVWLILKLLGSKEVVAGSAEGAKFERKEAPELKKTINLAEGDLLKVEQIVIDRDKEGALDFVREVIKKQIDRGNASKIKREGI